MNGCSSYQVKAMAFPSLCSGRATFPPFQLGGLHPYGLGLRPRAATALCRVAAGPGSIVLLHDLQSPLTQKPIRYTAFHCNYQLKRKYLYAITRGCPLSMKCISRHQRCPGATLEGIAKRSGARGKLPPTGKIFVLIER
jgi:hypothetical protein